MSNVNRRQFLGISAAAAGATLLNLESALGAAPVIGTMPVDSVKPVNGEQPVITILHLTDSHIRPELDAPTRCRKILDEIFKKHTDVNFIVNSGDSIFAADYADITRERVEEQWKVWDETIAPFLKGRPVIHAIGNHDPWWAGPEGDAMRGYPYVCQRLGLENPYYTTRQGPWDILVLNNSKGSVDAQQWEWIAKTLPTLRPDAPLLVVSHLPIYSVAGLYSGSNMADGKKLVEMLAERKPPIIALSGHIHVQSSESLWNINFHCNGSLSGYWWGAGEQGDGSYKRTPMGYAIVKLWADGRSDSHYYPVPYK